MRCGSGSTKGIGQEIGKFAVVTMEIPWNLTKTVIGGTPEQVLFVTVDQFFGPKTTKSTRMRYYNRNWRWSSRGCG